MERLTRSEPDKAERVEARKARGGALAISGVVRSTPRLLAILRVLKRHGITGIVHGRQRWPPPAVVREALEELGAIFLKFGQVLALRRDLLPAPCVTELERLHDRVPPMGRSAVLALVERELGAPPGKLFAEFGETPLAAATIAPAHVAVLPDGRRVAVKIRRDGLEERIAEDTAILTYLATLAERYAPQLRALDLVGMAQEFRISLRREVDFRREARTIRRFRAELSDVDSLWIPDVVDERSGAAVLTMEQSPGTRIDQYGAEHPAERPPLARRIATLVLQQVFATGLFPPPAPRQPFHPAGRAALPPRLRDDRRALASDARAATWSG